ncbi:hypothetical protein NDU88_008264 [Pleurodeles waltl]|uniref:Uncharacterized protein n=1 Tax=Pleurodeles waltl TaxID=8319 RepID=A0AAV7PTV9_PLEWA|nr:hypothetical protein NDU88_008264 [Pleurodeles waltl]
MLAVEVNLLRADLRKVSDKVKVAEGSIVELQTEVGALRKQMVQASSTVGRLAARLEGAEGRSQRNNIRLLGFLERAEGSVAETFVENWIKDVLQPAGLSRVFVVPHLRASGGGLEMDVDLGQGHSGQIGEDSWAAHRTSGADSPDWRTRGGSQLEVTVARVAAADYAH